MTSAESDASTSSEPDTEGCLLLAAGYADITLDFGPVTMEATRRIMTSPELGDFFEVRFVDLGPKPQTPADDTAAAELISKQFTCQPETADRNYFALVIIDRSATAAARLLAACSAHPVMARLPLRCRGLAGADDRQPGTGPTGEMPPAAAKIAIPDGGLDDRSSLASELRRYAAELLQDFAAGNEPGLTLEQISQILSAKRQDSAGEPSCADMTHGLSADSVPATHGLLPPPALPPSALPCRLARPPEPEPERLSASHPGFALRAPAHWRTALGTAARRLRLLPGSPGTARRTAAPVGPSGTVGLVYLLLIIDRDTAGKAWRRGRSVLRQLDKALASSSQASYRVRVLCSIGQGHSTDSGLRDAGQLKRRDIRQSVARLSFPQALGTIRADMRCDLAAGGAHPLVAPPAVVFYAAGVPRADRAAAELYGDLADEAPITWIVPGHRTDPLPSAFVGNAARIFIDHQAVASQVLTMLHGTEAVAITGQAAATDGERSTR